MDNLPVILLADDDLNDIFFLRRAFQKAQVVCQIIDVANGQEAVRYLEGHPPYNNRSECPLPHLLLLDLKMPLMNGFDVLSWLETRQEFAELPVLVLSSSAHDADVSKAHELGARGYHVKPGDLSQLIGLAKELGSKWLGSSTLSAKR